MESDSHGVANEGSRTDEKNLHDSVVHGDEIREDIDVTTEEKKEVQLLGPKGDTSAVSG